MSANIKEENIFIQFNWIIFTRIFLKQSLKIQKHFYIKTENTLTLPQTYAAMFSYNNNNNKLQEIFLKQVHILQQSNQLKPDI